LQKLNGHKPEIKTEKAARDIVAEVEKLPFIVTSVSTGERRRKAPAPFTTSTMQQEAAKQLGFSAGRTMRAAQKLYEGVELGEQGSVGLITYMRTDSVRVPDDAGGLRGDEGRLRPGGREVPVPRHRLPRVVQRLPRALQRGARG